MQPHSHTPSNLWEGDPTDPSDQELERLRKLLFGQEIRALAELWSRLDALELSPEELAEKLPEAVALRTARDDTLGQALGPTLSHAFDEAVQRQPEKITEAIFPIIGPAIRKAIADTISGLVQTINEAFEHSLSFQGLKWRVESWRTGVPYGEVVIKHSLVYRVEHVFLIHNQTGLLLSQVTAEGLEAPDADVISGMLTAIRDFVQDSFTAEPGGRLSRMTVADTTVHVVDGPVAMIAAVVRGHPPEAFNERLAAVIERVHLLHRRALTEFEGDPAPLEPTTPILAEALETVTSRRKSGRSYVPRMAWGVVLLVMLAGVAWFVRERARWNAALSELETTPGIVVVEARRGLRRWHLSGLADPDAPDPNALLATREDSTRLDTRWEPYLSFDPTVVVTRARRTLAPPAGAELSLRGDTLVVDGRVTPSWVRDARDRLAPIPGVNAIAPGNVTWDVPAHLEQRRTAIERVQIDFFVGSASLDPADRAVLDSLAAEVSAAVVEADVEAFAVQLDITGRADSTGTPEINRRLSEARAAAVRAYLVGRGVPPAIMRAQGIGTLGAGTANRDRTVRFTFTFILRPENGPRSE